MATIKLRNKRRRVFVCDLEKNPKATHQTHRVTHDPGTGEEGIIFHDFQSYDQIRLEYMEETGPLDDSVLQNASVQGAVRNKHLQVIKL